MKKLVLAAAVLAAVSFAACGNKEAANTDTDTVVVDDTAMVVASDSDSTVVAAETVTETALVADQPAQ